MADNKIRSRSAARASTTLEVTPKPSMTSRLVARFRARRLDQLIAVGVPAPAGSAQAAHEARVTSSTERAAVAQSLRMAVADARGRGVLRTSRVSLHVPNITAAEDVIDTVTLRLDAPRPVNARGMARLRQILDDGTGPLYRYGRGDLRGRLGAALAAL
jgi:hypothetical protein